MEAATEAEGLSMPKVRNTRRQRAALLLQKLTHGPSWGTLPPEAVLSDRAAEEATRQYRSWVQSWILPEVRDLLPELRAAAKKAGS